jgi:hypothetical protein
MEYYEIEKLTFDSCLFNNIDATYILYLEDSPRIKSIKQQIEKYPLTKTIYIMHNPGYKKVKKTLPRQNSEADVALSHIVACEFGIKHKHDKIIVLEDDFIFETNLLEEGVTEEIEKFISQNSCVDHYFPGCTPFLAFPVTLDTKHWRVLAGGCAHAVIHTKKGMERLIEDYNNNKDNIFGIDLRMFATGKCYMYQEPLITQIFPETENKKTAWGSGDVGKDMCSYLITKWGIDTNTQPGFNYMYWWGRSSFVILIGIMILLVLLVYWVVKKLVKKESNNK